MTELCDLTATEARRLIGTREITAQELLQSCIARTEAVNPAVNAMVATCYDRARQEAENADRAAAAGRFLGPLHGLPFAVKDLTETAAVRTTYGSLIYADNVPTADARIVADIREAGGIMMGKTNTPEWGAGANTFNPVYGATGNPFDPRLVSGGSSGGSAVALATGMAPLATGSDMGGSLRTPAAYCGVVGFRATPGLVPSEKRPRLWAPFSVDGPMARTVEDIALLLSVIARHDARDPFSRPDRPSFSRLKRVDLASLRVGLSDDLGFARIDRRIRDIFRRRTGALAPAFKSCADIDAGLSEAHEVFDVLRGFTFATAYREMLEKHPDKVGALVADNTRYGLALTAGQVSAAELAHTKMYRRFQALFNEIDVLICPTVSIPPFPKEQPYPAEIEGGKVRSYIEWIAPTYGLTLMSNPIVCLPCGLDPTGMPFGVQLCGRQGADAETLAIAQALESHMASLPELARPIPDIERLAAVAA